ncbi:MAG: hypothetical protein CBC22_03685 [Alphaproteobacteria bacterium TMED62]|nr:MAG: hypothetical protein CBC22_03685 [Alphaproteobacteria bacterium TMED62]|tara:strand:+ start:12190 stop:13164 length:975 start_codon:yes stop_codon:yes gene_type:complete
MYIIRVATASNFGQGHINRCLKIRKKINSKVVWFVDKGTKKNLLKILQDEIIEEKNHTSFLRTEKYAIKYNAKCIIIDNPEIEKFRKNNILRIKPVVIFVDKYLLVNNVLSICMHPININKRNFISGLKYLPFIKKSQKLRKNKKIKNILVSFGNVDTKCFTEKIIKTLQELTFNGFLMEDKFKVNIILGKYKMNITSIRRMISLNKNFTLFRNPTSLDKIYNYSDFAIGAPGFSQIERLEYNIPTVLVAQNEIQKKLLTSWEESGCALIVKNIHRDLKQKILLMVQSDQTTNNIKEMISKQFDNHGTSRILEKIENYIYDYNN